MKTQHLSVELTELVESVQGDVSICFKNLNSNETFNYNENRQFNTASLMKVVVALEFLLGVERKEIPENCLIKLKNSFVSKLDNSYFELSKENDSEKELYSKIGTSIPAMELLELMITRSSNLATNNIFDLINKNNSLSQLLNRLEMHNTQIIRGVEDQKSYDAGIINFTTASDFLKLFEFINNRIFSGNKYVNVLYEILKKQEDNKIIPQFLPNNLHIAHKTGSIKSVRHDAGLISNGKDINYILVILTKNLADTEKSIYQLAKISELFYKSVINV